MANTATSAAENNTLQIAKGAVRALRHVVSLERRSGTLLKTLQCMREQKAPAFYEDWTYGQLLEWAAQKHQGGLFLEYQQQRISFDEMNRRVNRVAQQFRVNGIGSRDGVAIMMANHPHFLDAFFAIQKLGAYAVPVNTALVHEGLAYILTHSEVKAIVCDHEAAEKIAAVRDRLTHIKHIWVVTDEAPASFQLPEGMQKFSALEVGSLASASNPRTRPDPEAPSLLLYTSGTTGLPKAVVSPYGKQRVKAIGILANLLAHQDDKIYTCLPLFHANALLLSVMQCLWVGIPLHLAKRFSASRFWQEVSTCGATQFNTVGSMIPVLLKTPPTAYEQSNKVRRVISAACPKDAWKVFEDRFGVRLWEGYGAVDGAGITIINMGNAPVGSIGRPGRNVRWKLKAEDGSDAGVGQPGELCVYVANRPESKVPYWKNEKASNEKVIDGWLHTGDMLQKDEKNYLYFVGRNTDSMRVRGENVSAYEVEKVADSYPGVLESAAFGVPSSMGESDIMISVIPIDAKAFDVAAFTQFMRDNLPKYAVPTYLNLVSEFPKTGTHRVIKKELKERGITPTTITLDERVAAGQPRAANGR
jgi:crotonobetaine/carnitine-CoA ligase